MTYIHHTFPWLSAPELKKRELEPIQTAYYMRYWKTCKLMFDDRYNQLVTCNATWNNYYPMDPHTRGGHHSHNNVILRKLYCACLKSEDAKKRHWDVIYLSSCKLTPYYTKHDVTVVFRFREVVTILYKLIVRLSKVKPPAKCMQHLDEFV